jgi:hypothetical protein
VEDTAEIVMSEHTLRNVQGVWVNEQQVTIQDD